MQGKRLLNSIEFDVPDNIAGDEGSKMVGEIGFEPTAPWSQTRCATRLRHSPTPARA